MAAAVIRNMTHTHTSNFNGLSNNCAIMSQTGATPQSPVIMHHHQNLHVYNHHYQQHQPQQIHQQQPQPLQQQHQPQQQHSTPHHQLGKRPIAPAPAEHNRSSVISNIDQSRISSKKAKLAYAQQMPYGVTQPASVQRRNARERNRVKQVNNGFANLRQHIPSEVVTNLTSGGRGASKKLSKVDTLRMAVEYIRRLQDMLDDNENDSTTSSSSRLSQNSTGSYYSPSPMECTSVPPPSCSESSASPTPSYTSDNSSIPNTYAPAATYKYEVFDPYNPEDEELLDCITWWQQQ